MTGRTIQTLEDLRKSADAAWLWDGMRGRLVWANAAGIAAFDGQSVFDLIDRVFDADEAGVKAISALTRSLKRDEIEKTELLFPSTGRQEPWNCDCWLHTLADGRSGLLVVSRAPKVLAIAGDGLFAQMPVAAVMLGEDGALSQANAMAAGLFDIRHHTTLESLLGHSERAAKLLARLQSTNLVSAIESFEGLYGKREARLTLRRLTGDNAAFAMFVMDDITERRSMERQMADAMPLASAEPAKPSGSDAQAFEALAQRLNEAISESVKDAAPPKPIETAKPAENAQAKPDAPRNVRHKPVSPPPRPIVDGLERTGAAIIVAQSNAVVFATQKALQVLGYQTDHALYHDDALWEKLRMLRPSHAHLAMGNDHNVDVVVSTVPWFNGPAQQFVLTPLKSPVPAPVEKPIAKLAAAVAQEVEAVNAAMTPAPTAPVVVPPAVAAPVAEPALATAVLVASHEAEDELKSILDIASDGIITLDHSGKILSFSAGAESIFGYRSAEVKAKAFAEFFIPESRKALLQYLAGLQGPGLASVFNDGREVNAIVKQGGTVPLFMTIGTLQRPGSPVAFCAVVRDITTWKRTEKELREAKEAAEAASKQKSEFLARISHELRTPLNAILGFSDVMRLQQFGEIKNEKYRGYVNDIHTSGSHLLALINDLLDLSKIEAGKMELNFTAVNVADCADHAIKLLQETATRARVLVRKSFPEKLPRVVADLRAMRQVMINLLSNAIKFTDPGGQVIISTSVSATGELALKLKDTGIGMNAAQIKDALEPFKRVETTGRETQGTGLGLPLTRALVEANRAKFSLSSEPGQGTLIEITFPTTRVLAE